MNILYLGDIMAGPGLRLIERELPALRTELAIDFVVAQSENVSDGKGLRVSDFERLLAAGVDVCTGGNHTLYRDEIYPLLNDQATAVIRPANYTAETPGKGYVLVPSTRGPVLVVSLLGQIVGRDADKPMDNPLQAIDSILLKTNRLPHVATVVNLHGDFSSEKVVIGHYLDGHVSMVVGDHWHVPTADARVLPGGTAHMTDVGMCGALNSSLGVTYSSIIPRWRDGKQTRNTIEIKAPWQLNGLLATIDEQSGLATSAVHVRRIYDS